VRTADVSVEVCDGRPSYVWRKTLTNGSAQLAIATAGGKQGSGDKLKILLSFSFSAQLRLSFLEVPLHRLDYLVDIGRSRVLQVHRMYLFCNEVALNILVA
jgi:hypothetical protein